MAKKKEMAPAQDRGHWSSQYGFILAAAGSAIGLGNLWKFPYVTYENGGALFVLFYILCILFVGLPIMVGEIVLGKITQKNPIGAFKALAGNKSPFRWVGYLGVITGFVILSYYAVVSGWSIENSIKAIQHDFDSIDKAKISQMIGDPKNTETLRKNAVVTGLKKINEISEKKRLLVDSGIISYLELEKLPLTEAEKLFGSNLRKIEQGVLKRPEASSWAQNFYARFIEDPAYSGDLKDTLLSLKSQRQFDDFIGNPKKTILWQAVIMLLVMVVLLAPIRKGIELASKLMMPVLFLILIILVIVSVSQDRSYQTVNFMFSGDPAKFKLTSILDALGHSFFTLSLGMGAIITLGSYLNKQDNSIKSAIMIVSTDTLVSFLACFLIFPILFVYNFDPGSSSIGILFTTLPVMLAKLPGGEIVSLIFYILVFFAAFTSAISLLEVVAAAFIDELRLTRMKAVWIGGLLVFTVGLPSAYSISFLGNADKVASNILLPLGGFFIAIFVGYRLNWKLLAAEFEQAGFSLKFLLLYRITIRYVTPILVLAVFIHLFYTKVLN